jgi:hypothetical protein
MNGNLLVIVKQIAAQQGEAILGDPQRLKGFIRGFAKNEPLPLCLAFDRAVEEGAYNTLKTAPNSGERSARKAAIRLDFDYTRVKNRLQKIRGW